MAKRGGDGDETAGGACALSKSSVLRRGNEESVLQFGRGRGAARMALLLL
jgi:hypothetical protein